MITFIVLGQSMSFGVPEASSADQTTFNLPILAALITAVSTVMSLVAIISIYREGGILKRPVRTCRAVPFPLQVVAYGLPTTHSVTLMQGIWDGSGWGAHWRSVAALILLFWVFTALSTRVFRWEGQGSPPRWPEPRAPSLRDPSTGPESLLVHYLEEAEEGIQRVRSNQSGQ